MIEARPPDPAALDGYLDYVRDHRSLRTFRTYRPMLASFKAFCAKTYIDETDSLPKADIFHILARDIVAEPW